MFDILGCTVEWFKSEGDVISPLEAREKIKVARVSGPVSRILLGERTALNILARASGIATQAKAVVSLTRTTGWHGSVAGTRKTTVYICIFWNYSLMLTLPPARFQLNREICAFSRGSEHS